MRFQQLNSDEAKSYYSKIIQACIKKKKSFEQELRKVIFSALRLHWQHTGPMCFVHGIRQPLYYSESVLGKFMDINAQNGTNCTRVKEFNLGLWCFARTEATTNLELSQALSFSAALFFVLKIILLFIISHWTFYSKSAQGQYKS